MISPQGLAVQIICSCDEIPDEGVEVLVLRGLLTATTSLTFTLHGQALLLAVRTCYNIHLMSRSEVNQTTAKATLTQMLNVVFQRMEAGSVKIAVSAGSCSASLLRPIMDARQLQEEPHTHPPAVCDLHGVWSTAPVSLCLLPGSSVLPVFSVIACPRSQAWLWLLEESSLQLPVCV
jgi:hypothetical protein